MSQPSSQDANKVYNIRHWGSHYFSVSDQGQVMVKPSASNPEQLNLKKLVGDLCKAGLTLPILVRFPDILQDRVNKLCDAFDQAIASYDYQGGYTAVYPIKVNQLLNRCLPRNFR